MKLLCRFSAENRMLFLAHEERITPTKRWVWLENYSAAKICCSVDRSFAGIANSTLDLYRITTSLLKLNIRQDVDSGELSRPTYLVFLVLRTALHQQLWLSLINRLRFYSLEIDSNATDQISHTVKFTYARFEIGFGEYGLKSTCQSQQPQCFPRYYIRSYRAEPAFLQCCNPSIFHR